MTLSLKHANTVVELDDPAYPVGTNEWNAEHVLTQAADRILGRLSTSGATQELTAAQVNTFLGGAAHPGTSTDNAIARYDGTVGALQNSSVIIADAGTVTIAPTAASSTLGLVVNQSGPLSGSTTGTISNSTGGNSALLYNSISVDVEGANVTGSGTLYTAALNIGLVTGGTNSTGQKYGLNVFLFKPTASTPATARDHVAIVGSNTTDAGDGGTAATVADGKGTVFAGGFESAARSGATNLFSVVGVEIGAAISTGASAAYRFGLNISGKGNLQGSVLDAAIAIGGGGGSWTNGLLFTDANGQAPVTSSGALIATSGARTVTTGIDFSSYTISGNFLKGPSGFSVSGAGALTAVSATAPLVIGGTAVGSSLTLKSTSGVGTTDFIDLLVGNDGATRAMRAVNTGQVIIGHTASVSFQAATQPSFQIHTTNDNAFGLAQWRAATTSANFLFAHSRSGTVGTHTILQSGDRLGNIAFAGSDGTAFIPAAAIRALVDGTPGTNDMPGSLVFGTTADGASAITDRLTLDSAGVLKPVASGGVALGTAALPFSDLFLVNPLGVAYGGTGQATEAEAVGELIQALTEDTAPVPSTDMLGTYDASADTGKKVTYERVATQTRGVPGYITNRYYNGALQTAAATLAIAANTLYAVLIYIGKKTTFTRIGIEVTSGGAGGTTARIGMFDATGSGGGPGTLITDHGTVAVDSTGIKEITISAALEVGAYWMVVVSDGTPTLRAGGTTAAQDDYYGQTTFGTRDPQVSRAFTYGVLSGASPFGAATFATGNQPAIALRVV